ncbi:MULTISPECIES: carboxypeptidase-like regulatory domain-containing protein [Roseivirga]|uniref:TonB-dependent receptor plug domain-containing protein n=1 Tax=Roseivirga spongicola TaxID=333140 RepID=A0A150XHZ3_9BACT|nr:MULTISPECIES: carboxypeptidase-like regulatory domain-containing protein [Roseivirga]KYG78302.1 hypothetical protein AWW68_05925 [Roseivirga spongicola]MBO6660870.1 carboxypeptidase-like regulatory domain-containing protein [Roseivirga sp.]MBO6759466.1 carboxypeptidase-like regulatory domain-containing protein [Roseivirga sp.]MBO6909146.1 carboxypeptidase-like regulatory domain-containing protein [Roseivirga sp.]WPZ12052.1 carboxypeptidase-like regulatory domain-containing protein [Roseivir
MRLVLTLFLLITCCFSAIGQEELLRGKIVDAKTGFAVPYASVLLSNKSQGMGASGEGKFRFEVENGDTLQISSIGYETLQLLIDRDKLDFDKENVFELKPAVYELDSIEIIQLSDNFYLKRPKLDTLELGIYRPRIIRDWNQMQTIPFAHEGQMGITISGFLNSFDKKIQQEKIINEFKKSKEFKKQRQAEREKYFNKELVKRVTRIDDRVIDEFMEYCNFLDGQIIGKTEYQVTLLILKKYKEFLVR